MVEKKKKYKYKIIYEIMIYYKNLEKVEISVYGLMGKVFMRKV